jgi:hypothetical protein
MLKFRLEITCDNAAFDDAIGTELGRILRDLATRIEDGEATRLYQNVRDINGNPCGTFRLKEENRD